MKAGSNGRVPPDVVRRRSVLVALVAAVSAAAIVASVWLTILNGGPSEEAISEMVTLGVALYAYLAVGLLLLAKTPRNPLGWALTGVGLLAALGSLATGYAEYSLGTVGRHLPGATFAAWINSWWWFPTITLVFLFVPLLFPNGTPLTPRWRWLHRVSVGLLVMMVVGSVFNPMLEGDTYAIVNPIGIAAIGDVEESALGGVIFGTLLACTVLSLLSLILRFRRSSGVERQQMKWFVFGSSVIIMMVVIEETLATLHLDHLVPDSNIIFGIAVGLLPATIGIAVLKYRLYEIDRLISRTLSYGLLTAVLLALYLTAVTAITRVTAPVTGESPIGVAAATLLAAAAFGPARRRIQSVVDRRFNRARYDAARTVDAYRTSLRDEVDVATLHRELLAAVDGTMQPTKAMLWVRDAAATVRS